jgi:hypothetical protein
LKSGKGGKGGRVTSRKQAFRGAKKRREGSGQKVIERSTLQNQRCLF